MGAEAALLGSQPWCRGGSQCGGEGIGAPGAPGYTGDAERGLHLCDLKEVSPPRPVLFVNGDVETRFQGMRKREEGTEDKRPRGMESLYQWFSKCGLGIPMVPGALSRD